jgi:hypothetical protein
VAIGSNTTNLSFDDVVSSLLLEDMRWKNMEGHSTHELFARGLSQKRNISKSSSGRSKSPRNFCKCMLGGRKGHYKKQCRSKSVERGKGSEDSPSIEEKKSSQEGRDVYFSSSSTHEYHEAWLVDSGASFHMTPHREWFCEYERYGRGDVFLGDESIGKIIERGKFKLKLMDGMIIKLLGVIHIPRLVRKLIFVSKMDDAWVKTMFEK